MWGFSVYHFLKSSKTVQTFPCPKKRRKNIFLTFVGALRNRAEFAVEMQNFMLNSESPIRDMNCYHVSMPFN